MIDKIVDEVLWLIYHVLCAVKYTLMTEKVDGILRRLYGTLEA